MKDQYVGDIGDFANNGLLRVLCGTTEGPVPGMRLGIIWYRNPLQDRYGNQIGYLNSSGHNDRTYRECDPDLYRELQKLVGRRMERDERRLIEDIMESNILPPGTRHHEENLPNPANRIRRNAWLERAILETEKSDVIFLNPDTGIGWNGMARLGYVHPWELRRLLETKKVLVIYQHAQRGNWVAENVRRLTEELPGVRHLWACVWNPAPTRGYFIIAQTDDQRDRIEERLEVLRRSQWMGERGFFAVEEAGIAPAANPHARGPADP